MAITENWLFSQYKTLDKMCQTLAVEDPHWTTGQAYLMRHLLDAKMAIRHEFAARGIEFPKQTEQCE
jgi:hypothetical protein